MAKPPPTPPSSDVKGVNRDARVGKPNRDSGKGTAVDVQRAEEQSKGRPAASGKLSDKSD